jgi:hypothetical protein
MRAGAAIVLTFFACLGFLTLGGGVARANGRFPVALFLTVGPGDQSSTFALSTTFGLVTSFDGGRTWQYTCEEGIGYDPRSTWDMTMALTTSGALVLGLPDGVAVARQSVCTFERPARPFESTVDLSVDGAGERVVAAVTTQVRADGVALSDDGGATWRMGWTRPDFFISNVDIAPSDARRVYVSGLLDVGQPSRVPMVLRSEDRGQTFTDGARNFTDSAGVYLSGVDAANPDIVYLRSDHLRDGGTSLLRSTDGGRTFTTLIATPNPMTGVALAPDGRVWVGSPGAGAQDGIFRSGDGGNTWQRVASGYTTLCLKYRNGILYMCAGGVSDGFALGCSTNGGETFSPMLVWDQLVGPGGCAPGSSGRELCQEAWNEVRPMIVPDGGARPAGSPCLLAPADAGPVDAAIPADTAAFDASPPGPSAQGCSCRMAPGRREPGGLLVLVLVYLSRSRGRTPRRWSGSYRA